MEILKQFRHFCKEKNEKGLTPVVQVLVPHANSLHCAQATNYEANEIPIFQWVRQTKADVNEL